MPEQVQTQQADDDKLDVPEPVKNFWRTLPGVLTAASGVIVATTGLVSALGANGLLGFGQGSAQGVHNPPPSPQPRPQMLAALKVRQTSDGYAAVRKQPTITAPMVTSVASGTQVSCKAPVPDKSPSEIREWRECPQLKGFIAAKLLIAP